MNNTDFASTIVNDKSSSAKTLERAALNAGLGTASTRALNRAKQTVLHNNADDYEENFNHLAPWGRRFVHKNHGSHFDVQKDENDRFVLPDCDHALDTFDPFGPL